MTAKGFHCFDPKANRLRIYRHVMFLDHIPFYSLLVASLPPCPPCSPDPFPNLSTASMPCFSSFAFPHVYHRQARESVIIPADFLSALALLIDATPCKYPLCNYRPVDRYCLIASHLFSPAY